ncbi:hypothetical protein HPB49_001310 [Dermacentor silvarum]|uniref:Uncharacterized protein n=1 Tax=Dermacentor silvarum TaxID=543639 RepID=A0ACB8CNY3_DERSI|nr:hypothetical protein HPB49_001310 [Dermacentor silvarum]
MPQLPEAHINIIRRRRGGPNLNKNIEVVSTPKPEHAAKYVRIKAFKIVETEYKVNAYTRRHRMPRAKGVIRRVDIRDTQAMITWHIVHDLNPLALATKRIKSSGPVLVIFDGIFDGLAAKYVPL